MTFAQTLTGVFALIFVIGCIAGSGCLDNTQTPQDNEAPEAAWKDVDPENPPSEIYLFDDANNGENHTIVQDSLIIITLEENPTTGYQWNISVTDRLSVLGETYEPSDTSGELVGAGGRHVWVLYAFDTGTYTFNAVYKRPWEELTGDEETFVLTFIVE
jgi:inhibitor of cysteine peptidase